MARTTASTTARSRRTIGRAKAGKRRQANTKVPAVKPVLALSRPLSLPLSRPNLTLNQLVLAFSPMVSAINPALNPSHSRLNRALNPSHLSLNQPVPALNPMVLAFNPITLDPVLHLHLLLVLAPNKVASLNVFSRPCLGNLINPQPKEKVQRKKKNDKIKSLALAHLLPSDLLHPSDLLLPLCQPPP